MRIVKQIIARRKVVAVIESCENCFHYKTAEKLIENYHKLFGDLVGKLKLKYKLKEIKLKNLGK